MAGIFETQELFWQHGVSISIGLTLSPLERRDIQFQTGYTGRCVFNSRLQILGTEGEYSSASCHEGINFSLKSIFMMDVSFEVMTSSSSPADDAIC